MSDEQTVELSLEQVADYEFRVRFDGTAVPDLATDESAPLGRGAGPNPSRLLAAAVAFLASDDSSFISASTFLVDGGISSAYVTPL